MHIQLNENGTYWRTLPDGNVEFSQTVFQPAHTLTPEQCEEFRVRPLERSAWPYFDPMTHRVEEGDPVLQDGQWVQVWNVIPLTEAELEAKRQQARDEAKRKRAEAVAGIKVTISNGWVFDGDEASQTRMSRAIIGMLSNQTEAGGPVTINWVLADNSVVQVTAAELTEALTLAGIEQARLWVIE